MRQAYITAIDANKRERVPFVNKTIRPSIAGRLSSFSPGDSSYVIDDTRREIFSEAKKEICNIADETVRRQALDVMSHISRCLQNIDTTSIRFPKLSITQNEDGSCLLEWHFTQFHIGLSLEPDEKDSYYFFVYMDESIGKVDTKTRRINGELEIITNDIVQFVIDNV